MLCRKHFGFCIGIRIVYPILVVIYPDSVCSGDRRIVCHAVPNVNIGVFMPNSALYACGGNELCNVVNYCSMRSDKRIRTHEKNDYPGNVCAG